MKFRIKERNIRLMYQLPISLPLETGNGQINFALAQATAMNVALHFFVPCVISVSYFQGLMKNVVRVYLEGQLFI